MGDAFEISAVVPATPREVYDAWVSSEAHTAFTMQPATFTARAGGKFSCFNGAITGTTTKLKKGARIEQKWRAVQFPNGADDSDVTITFDATDGGTRIGVHHRHLPAGHGPQFETGWKAYYFRALAAYFDRPPTKAAKKKPAKNKTGPR